MHSLNSRIHCGLGGHHSSAPLRCRQRMAPLTPIRMALLLDHFNFQVEAHICSVACRFGRQDAGMGLLLALAAWLGLWARHSLTWVWEGVGGCRVVGSPGRRWCVWGGTAERRGWLYPGGARRGWLHPEFPWLLIPMGCRLVCLEHVVVCGQA